MTVHRRERRLIERHFAGRQDPDGEQEMRRHLGECESCSAYYNRHAVLARLDPAAPRAQERLAAGLGFANRASSPLALLTWAVAPVAAALILVAWLRQGAVDRQFASRGTGHPDRPALVAYRASLQPPTPLGSVMTPGEELAFAYENPGGYRHLMVVGVDDRGKLYWFHPDPDVTGAALPITGGPGRVELPEAIRHAYGDGSLRILGLFSHEPLTVSRVAGLIDRSGCTGLRIPLPGVACTELTVLVERPDRP